MSASPWIFLGGAGGKLGWGSEAEELAALEDEEGG